MQQLSLTLHQDARLLKLQLKLKKKSMKVINMIIIITIKMVLMKVQDEYHIKQQELQLNQLTTTVDNVG